MLLPQNLPNALKHCIVFHHLHMMEYYINMHMQLISYDLAIPLLGKYQEKTLT